MLKYQAMETRELTSYVAEDLGRKILLISGPRQVGKTTLAQRLLPGSQNAVYLNFDNDEHRAIIMKKAWARDASYVLFDELHKLPDWKRWLKGIYDTEGLHPPIVVTGSARMDVYRSMGDSLAGRYFSFRLHPLDVAEAHKHMGLEASDALHRILEVGGFPEPFIQNDPTFYRRWASSHFDVILKQDLAELPTLRRVADLRKVRLLVDRLRHGVGNPVSHHGMAQDLSVSGKTIAAWIDLLEELYLVFKVTPFHRNIARANQKQSKVYFYDSPRVVGIGPQLENAVGCALIKTIHHLKDTLGMDLSLHFIRLQGGLEIDFLICKEGTPVLAIEVKTSDETPSRSFRLLKESFTAIEKVQLVLQAKQRLQHNDINVEPAASWLAKLPEYLAAI